MSSSVDKSSGSQSPMLGQIVVYAGIAWAVLALLFFLLFSISVPGEDPPLWYRIGTYIFEEVAFLGGAILCFRNWQSPQIASGRNVWLGIGLGMLSYFLGNLLFCWWELYWGLDPAVSLGDLFFVAFYLFLGWGMILAVLPRRLNLENKQWVIVGAIASVAIALAVWLSLASPADSEETSVPPSKPAIAQVSPATQPKTTAPPKKAPTLKATPKAGASAQTKPPASKPPAETAPKNPPPGWVLSLEDNLKPLAKPVSFFYIICDVVLLIIAATLLLAFWGGRFSQSWRMIAAAAFSFYIADMWFKYATDHIPDYQSGFILEVFWVFSGVLFAVGAALEYDTSIRSNRRGARKRA